MFTNCSAGFSGGAIFIYCRDVNVKPHKEIQESDEYIFSIEITDSNFTECKSGVEGGAISSGIYDETTKKAFGDNDMEIKKCYFIRCESGTGGALYFKMEQKKVMNKHQSRIVISMTVIQLVIRKKDMQFIVAHIKSRLVDVNSKNIHAEQISKQVV